MLLKLILVMESMLMSPVRTNLPQLFKFLSLILESHSTMEGEISPTKWGGEEGMRESVIAIVAL